MLLFSWQHNYFWQQQQQKKEQKKQNKNKQTNKREQLWTKTKRVDSKEDKLIE